MTSKRTNIVESEKTEAEAPPPEAPVHTIRVGKLSEETVARIEKLIASARERGSPGDSILAKGDLELRSSKKGSELVVRLGRYGRVRRALNGVFPLPPVAHGAMLPTLIEG